ncbi:M14 family zinc carboxypeptidase [Candidatus Uabimicrobium amorphum]|uniref:Peptidase M14 domain-containing protein n=1 Tax=Uabimicrobium amorphum TaxID=2596890 RepID=A0A5S9IPV6_UABAM|nr:M14 family zinc carboxypeptidase [Candidatus Uabimicrobium amorphum]BBM85491.1 hypothetical protein UABAM_03860 [Candidatus Uabimicrobium amorphum]
MNKYILIIVVLLGFTYTSEEEYQYVVATIEYLQKKYPKLVRRVSIGKSVEKRDLTVLRISAAEEDNVPSLYLGSSIHGHELSHRPGLYVCGKWSCLLMANMWGRKA